MGKLPRPRPTFGPTPGNGAADGAPWVIRCRPISWGNAALADVAVKGGGRAGDYDQAGRAGVGTRYPHQGPSCNSEGGKGGSKTDGIHLDGGVFQPCSFTITHPPWNRYVPFLDSLRLAYRLEAFSLAPVGTTSGSRKRHRAINSLRATATMAIRRIRPLALPTRSRNQMVKALLGW